MKTKLIILPFLLILGFYSCNKKVDDKNTIKEDQPSLKRVFQDNFYIGAAINKNQILGTDTIAVKLLEDQFSAITPENEMKFERIHPKKDSFYFDISDKYVTLGEENNMHIVGHTLVWHSQLASWMEEVKDSATMANNIENHIKTIVGRYKGRIHAWDVVNEALNEDGSLRASLLLKIMGPQYIEHAFKLAAEADPEAQLVYNDYNLTNPEKRSGVVRLVKQLKDHGVKIDAVGMQGHWSLNGPSIEEIENSIIAFSELGVKVMITELDITVLPNPWDLDGAGVEQNYKRFEDDPSMNPYPNKLADTVQTQLAKRYEAIFKLFIKHQDKIDRVTFWGVNDGNSWLNNWPIKGRTNYPLLFDRISQPKEAYKSVLALKEEN